MPRSQRGQARPGITFINSTGEGGDATSRRVARRHASYWGHRISRMQAPILSPHSPSSSHSPSHSYSRSSNSSAANSSSPENTESQDLAPPLEEYPMPTELAPENVPVNLHFGADFDTFHCLPQVWNSPGREAPLELLSVSSIMIDFFGESFIRRMLLRSGDVCNNRYAGCLLLCYAYYMAMTDSGSYDSFMRLKSSVIQSIREAVSSPEPSASLDTMIAIMALGTPIVCEATDPDLICSPSTRTDSSNSEKSTDGGSPRTSLSILEEGSSTEYDMHYQAITRLLRMQPDPAYLRSSDGRFIFLVKVISSAHRMLTLSEVSTDAWVTLFQKFELFSAPCPADACWSSPIFGSSTSLQSRPENTQLQSRCLELAVAVRDWFKQYKKSRRRMPNELDFVRGRLEHKLSARYQIESFGGSIEAFAVYDSCYIAASLMTEASDRSCSLAAAAAFVPRAAELPSILKRTDLIHLWGELRGMLYWVALICHIISRRSRGRKISTFILAHFTQVFASSSDIPIAAALTPIKELLEYP